MSEMREREREENMSRVQKSDLNKSNHQVTNEIKMNWLQSRAAVVSCYQFDRIIQVTITSAPHASYTMMRTNLEPSGGRLIFQDFSDELRNVHR